MKKAEYEKESSRTKERRHKSRERRGEKSHTHKIKESKSEELELKNVDISDMDFGDETAESFPKHLKPMRAFMDDRKEMIEQVFSTIHESSLNKFLPKELKNCNLDQIKSMCLEQLTTMSEDYILYILTGGNPDTYTEKSTEKEEESPVKDNPKVCAKRKRDEEPCVGKSPEKRSNTEDDVLEQEKNDGQSSEALELYASQSTVQSVGEEDSILSVLSDSNTDLDLLELEMRAKAIRALLKIKGLQSSDEEGKV